MDKRYQVFISSTFTDLKDERQSALKAILELDHMPAGMELFPAADESAWQLINSAVTLFQVTPSLTVSSQKNEPSKTKGVLSRSRNGPVPMSQVKRSAPTASSLSRLISNRFLSYFYLKFFIFLTFVI